MTAAIRSLAIVALLAGSALASPRIQLDTPAPTGPLTGSVCTRGEVRCFAHVQATPIGEIRAFATPQGYGPTELQSAYEVDTNITTTPTIAIVDAYGYSALESDLATYRAQFGLPPCTRANGCLKIVNENGQTTNLPPDAPADDDWTLETALDVDSASAICPRCKILVVQSIQPSNVDLYQAQNTAAALHPTVISDSWGRPTTQGEDLTDDEQTFTHPGIAQFVSAGDNGFDEGGQGPTYPSTSAHVIAVGGTRLEPSTNARGWTETAWDKGGSSCSFSIPKPAFQTASPCQFRAASDIAAVGDPQTGVAVFNARNGGWLVIGGTSAAAPIVAALFASIGQGNATAAGIAQSASALFDVTAGANGTCGDILCNATTGWDGPTGFGTPSAAKLSGMPGGGGGGGGGGDLAVTIVSPADGATVAPGFRVEASAQNAAAVGVAIDGIVVASTKSAPYVFATPDPMPAGPHVVQVVAIDAGNTQQVVAQITVMVVHPPDTADSGDGGGGGGCSATGNGSALVIVIALVLVGRRRGRCT